ncbi:MAG: hypothetical protein ACIWVG_15160 [Gloeotrichia echinulata HAB0833]
MTTIYFADLDILLKLAACDLLSELREHWRIPPNQCFVDERFKYTLNTSITRSGNYSSAALKRTAEFLNNHTTDITFNDPEEVIALDTNGIDKGERRIIIATKEPAEQAQPFFLATGDKRAINTLAALPSTDKVCQRISKRLQGRVICLESMMLTFIEMLGFEPVKAKVLASRHNDKVAADKTITAVFGSREKAEEHNVRSALQSYIAELPAQLLA